MRIDRFLANQGFGTRKEVKKLIKDKLVTVDQDIITDSAFQFDPNSATVRVEGQIIEYHEFVYLMMNKPAGVICATHDEQEETVMDLIAEFYKDLFPIGRLDKDTEGLLLFTNDGTFAHQVISGKKEIMKVYEVVLKFPFDKKYLYALENGIVYGNDELAKPVSVSVIEDNILHLGIAEGKYHQVKRMMHACNNEVIYLKRSSIGKLTLDETLELGGYRFLTEEEKESALQD